MIGITEAAKQTNRTRQSIHQAIKNGRISAKKDHRGQWSIDPVELFRVFEPASTDDSNVLSKLDDRLQSENQALQAEIKALTQERDRERRQLEQTLGDLRSDRDHWRDQAQKATALLTHQQAQKTRPPPSPGRVRRAWDALTGKL